MKTRRLAMALENERVGERSDHAAGLVSRMMDKRDGDCSGYCQARAQPRDGGGCYDSLGRRGEVIIGD